jgi:N-acetylglucosaminyldiphosphoundecaprenol N-acetyl-beta-D-mannosaminyltransferase
MTGATLERIQILGYGVLNESAAEVAAAVCDGLREREHHTFAFLNPHSIVLAKSDPQLRASIAACSHIFCDGVGLAAAARLLTRKRIHRVYGYEFFGALSRQLSSERKGRVFFLGGTDESLREIVAKYRAEFPGIEHVDAYAPPYRSEFSEAELSDMARRIGEHRCDVLWVGLGSPKQEKLLHSLAQGSSIRCAAAIGAVFDFYIDRIPHAPAWVRRMGLQWAHRLMLEPGRLWKRTFISGPLFLKYVAQEFIATGARREG